MNKRQEAKENYKYFLTTCGLIGFIVFFLGAFFAFIIAGEFGKYYDRIVALGFGMFLFTLFFFCYVMSESKHVSTQPTVWLSMQTLQPEQSVEPQPEQELLPEQQQDPVLQPEPQQDPALQPQRDPALQPEPQRDPALQPEPQQDPALQPEPQQDPALQPQPQPQQAQGFYSNLQNEPFWEDKTRHDLPYVRSVLGFPRKDSDETTISEGDSNPEMETLLKTESGLDAHNKEPRASTSKEIEYIDAGPSKVASQSSEVIEPRSRVSTLKRMSALSLSESD